MSLLKALDSSNNAVNLKVDSNGSLEVNISEVELNSSGLAKEAKQDSVISTLGDTNNKIDAMRGSNSLTDLATKLNAGLPSALDSDRLKCVLDANLSDTNSKIDAMRASDTLTTVKGVLDSLDGKITKGADLTLTEAQQTLSYGIDAFNTSVVEPLRLSGDKLMVQSFIASVDAGITNSLPSKEMRDYGSIQTLDSALSVPNGGNNDSSIVSNNKQTDKYIIQVQCDDNSYTDFNYEILESIDASNFQKTIEVSQPMTPAFFILEKIDNLAPNWKVRVNNTGASTKNFTIKYVKAD